ncbi:immunoglobulin domain-containing protein [uncultured Aquimarina sp.]|uniref:leucine-rich repeat domain-containing protein n=1 Tax=uncultured Aquimarina sp. TaxID=575652 RepID=UPI002606CFE3|nr:immunoglobulin domain-containing protein [uncultured Aquimarina sp.]
MKKLLLYLFLLLSITVSSQEISENDRNALVALYNATDGANWTNTWDLNDSPTNWYGVVTNIVFGSSGAERHVDEINLSDNNLTGIIPQELGNLKDLNTLELSNNNISGSIPGELGNAEDLNYLYLQNNNLNGDIPPELFSLNDRHFLEVNLSYNQLTGKLPNEARRSFANEGDLLVSNNLLTDLPDYTSSDLFLIKTLDISNNNIYFSVFERAPSIDNIATVLEDNVANLTYTPQNKIDATENIVLIEGENIMLSVTGLTSTNNTYQWFKNNTLIDGATNSTFEISNATTSDIGLYYCEIKNPQVPNLTIQRNSINVDTQGAIMDRTALLALYNSTNGANWSNPWNLNISFKNNWSGVAVDSETNRVVSLNLSQRGLEGELPAEIGNLSELTYLSIVDDASNSMLTGSLPEEIINLSKLEFIQISQTGLSGVIPSDLFAINSLNSVNLTSFTSNFLTLDLPNDLSHLTNLESLSLRRIDLSSEGSFPEALFQLPNLITLSLNSNLLTGGALSNEIGNLTKLQRLSLQANDFTGPIPEAIGQLSNLRSLNITRCGLNGNLPEFIGNLINLSSLTIFGNDIEGEIPNSFAGLANLTSLILTGNNLSGSIPDFLAGFNNLNTIRFDQNNFSGQIPDFTFLNPNNNSWLFFDDNNFVFEDFENEFPQYQTNATVFQFSPQSNVDSEETIVITEGEEIILSVEATQSSNNLYQWRKDGVEIAGAMERTYTISNSTTSDIGEYDCIITNSIVNDLTLFRNKITLDVTLGTEDFDTAGIKAYPVPTKDQLVLSLGAINGEHITASLYGMLGNKVFEQKNLTDNQILDFSNLQSGTYILKLQTNTKTYVSRIIKQ